MDWSVTTWILVAAGLLVAFFVLQLVWLSAVLAWEDRRTEGLGYFGRPLSERRAFRRTLRRHARFLFPILRLFGRLSRFRFDRASFRHGDLAGPRGTCSPQSFERAEAYEPRAEDIFVVTQMKSGTTWMQHLVYQLLERGEGDLVERGTALYAVSPWLEARKSVPVEGAPLVGSDRPSRLIKTHLPSEHGPWSPDARYIYVARHPVSCFASCVDFLAANAGALAPEVEAVESWYCSEDMWWGPWTRHVAGWWDRAREEENVLFVRFEEMKDDLPAVARRVEEFLALPSLTDAERERVVRRCGFDYMRRHREIFEMHPPHILATDAELFIRGTADRHRDVPDDVRRRIVRWCAGAMEGGPVRLETLYPGASS